MKIPTQKLLSPSETRSEGLLQHKIENWCKPCLVNISVFKRIFILDWIEYRILFALGKLTESNNEYYSCCEVYANSARYSNIFELFITQNWRICKNIKKLCFVKMPSVLIIIRLKLNYHNYSFLVKNIFSS